MTEKKRWTKEETRIKSNRNWTFWSLRHLRVSWFGCDLISSSSKCYWVLSWKREGCCDRVVIASLLGDSEKKMFKLSDQIEIIWLITEEQKLRHRNVVAYDNTGETYTEINVSRTWWCYMNSFQCISLFGPFKELFTRLKCGHQWDATSTFWWRQCSRALLEARSSSGIFHTLRQRSSSAQHYPSITMDIGLGCSSSSSRFVRRGECFWGTRATISTITLVYVSGAMNSNRSGYRNCRSCHWLWGKCTMNGSQEGVKHFLSPMEFVIVGEYSVADRAIDNWPSSLPRYEDWTS